MKTSITPKTVFRSSRGTPMPSFRYAATDHGYRKSNYTSKTKNKIATR